MDSTGVEPGIQQCPDNFGGPIWTRGESNSRFSNANAA